MQQDDILKLKYEKILPNLNEQTTRLYLGSEAESLGRGGKSLVSKLTGVSRVRIDKGISELNTQKAAVSLENKPKIRKAGGGRKKLQDSQAGILEALRLLVDSHTMGDPMRVLLWTNKSLRNLTKELIGKGFTTSYVTVGQMLKTLGYSLQVNKKTEEGGKDPDRNQQFEFINEKAISFISENEPVISVDCKKKELIGNYKNAGSEWFEQGKTPKVKVYDFIDKELGKAAPYGVYDIGKNDGWVSVGVSADTAAFAVNSIRMWWQQMGKAQYQGAKKLYINADGGGSNGSRNRLWKQELQLLSKELNIEIHVSHFPPGTSKWNKIEHRMFSQITINWRGKPLESIEVIVNLIANTTTKKGLKIKAQVDTNEYQTGIKITDHELAKINIMKNDFKGNWNYVIMP